MRAAPRLAHRWPRHAGLLHLLGEVEVVFGFLAFVLVLGMAWMLGGGDALQYAESRNDTEPLFVSARTWLGLALLKGGFQDGALGAGGLLLGALLPTAVAAGMFLLG